MKFEVGMKITHKVFGKGVVSKVEHRLFAYEFPATDIVVVNFNDTERIFNSVSILPFIV